MHTEHAELISELRLEIKLLNREHERLQRGKRDRARLKRRVRIDERLGDLLDIKPMHGSALSAESPSRRCGSTRAHGSQSVSDALRRCP